MKIPKPGCVGEFDWIDLGPDDRHGTRWARVWRTGADDVVHVILLEGTEPVRARVTWRDGSWHLASRSPDEIKIDSSDARYWRELLKEGPPMEGSLAHKNYQGYIWRPAREVA